MSESIEQLAEAFFRAVQRADLDAYREVYARTHGREIDLPALIEGILEQFLASDRAFQRHRRSTGPGDVQRLSG